MPLGITYDLNNTKNIKDEAIVWGQLIGLVVIWFSILFVTNTPLAFNWQAIMKLPDVAAVYVILRFVFTKWGWKIPQLQGWLVPFPDLQGTWEGFLKTTWTDPKTKKVLAPIRLVLVIRQTFSSINCVMYTKESNSYSITANFMVDDESGIKRLSYVYSNRPDAPIRDRSAVHDGAAILTIVAKPKKKLEGEYWTNRKTTGGISLTFKTKELLEGFPD
jgi:hypothetical protein